MCFRKRKPLFSLRSAHDPVGLILKLTTMKREFNRGGRPALSAAQRQKYIVSTRLDTPLYLQLKSLARQSGKQPAQIIRELIELG